MQVSENINQIELEVTLDGDVTPIVIDGSNYYPRNEYVIFTPSMVKDGNPFTNYSIVYEITNEDDEIVPIDMTEPSVGLLLDQLGDYLVRMTIEDLDNSLVYVIEYTVTCSNFLEVTQETCGTLVMSNKGTSDVTVTALELFDDASVANPDGEIVTPGNSITLTLDQISLYMITADYQIDGVDRSEVYIANNYCDIEECLAAYTLDIMCEDTTVGCDSCDECDCGSEIELNRMLALNYAYFMNANHEYGLNNFYSGLDRDTFREMFGDMKQIMDKLSAYCERRDCTSTFNTNSTTNCGCNG